MKRHKINWRVPKGAELTELDKKVLFYQDKGHLVPTRQLIKTPEQIEGIRRSFFRQDKSSTRCSAPIRLDSRFRFS